MNRLKLYTAEIPTEKSDGLVSISFVSKPANEGKFHIMSETDGCLQCSAPILTANKIIYRNDNVLGEHNIIFLPEVVEAVMNKAMTDKAVYSFDLEHSTKVEGISLVQSFLIDYDNGITRLNGHNGLNDGTWVGVFNVTNQEVIDGIKNGTYNGVSASLYAGYEEVSLSDAIEMYNALNFK